jgi:hypothetical protein
MNSSLAKKSLVELKGVEKSILNAVDKKNGDIENAKSPRSNIPRPFYSMALTWVDAHWLTVQ